MLLVCLAVRPSPLYPVKTSIDVCMWARDPRVVRVLWCAGGRGGGGGGDTVGKARGPTADCREHERRAAILLHAHLRCGLAQDRT